MNITVIGGGTGTSNVIQALKKYTDLKLSIVVGTMDDGGSNAVIKDEFGLLPLSDIRKSIISLAEDNDNGLIRDLFTYRFSEGEGLKGHTLGNLLMIALTDITGSEVLAIQSCKYMFGIRGDIHPATLDAAKLIAEYDDGSRVEGEHLIDEPKDDKKIEKFYLSNKVKGYVGAIEAIKNSDFLIIGPGDLYTTTLATIIVPEIADAISKSKAKVIFIPNLMSKIGQTRGYTQKEIIEIVEKHIKRKVDYILVNKGALPKEALDRYIKEGEHIFEDDLEDSDDRVVVRKDLVANSLIKKDKGDALVRSLIRHDPDKLGPALYFIFKKGVRRFLSTITNFYR